MFRNIAPVNNNSIPTSSLDSSYVAVCGDKRCCAINWSQKRFLRCLSPSSTGSTEGGANVNGQFTVNEIENRHKRSIQSLMSGNRFPSDKRNGQKENYRKSIKYGNIEPTVAIVVNWGNDYNVVIIFNFFKIEVISRTYCAHCLTHLQTQNQTMILLRKCTKSLLKMAPLRSA